jgi:DNA-binding transcriptional LysR family regulator
MGTLAVDLDDLKAFIEIVESGGFSRAARRLGVSKSVLSRRIARLESDLGSRLLSRTTRGLSATETGLEFKARSERILADVDEARESVARRGGDVVGHLRLSAPLSFGVRHVGPVVAEIARRHPRLEIDVSYSDRIVDLIGERFDAAIRIGVLKDSTLVARRIAGVRALLVASPDYLAKAGRPRTPGDLVRHECLIYTGSVVREWAFRSVGKRRIAVRPEGRLRTDNGDVLLQWAVEGLGIALVPSFLLTDEIESERLEPLLADYALPDVGIHVVRPPGAYVPGKVRVLIDILVERFGGQPVWDRSLMRAKRV